MSYGVPYQGSKSKLAAEIVNLLPKGSELVDVFAGGCAVTHAALLSGKWERIRANDLDGRGLRLFIDAANGRYKDKSRWIGREEFYQLKDKDPYVALCWSFSNGMETYLYNVENEPFKKILHEMCFAATVKERCQCWRQFLAEYKRLEDDISRLTEEGRALCAECGVVPVCKADGRLDGRKTYAAVYQKKSEEIREYLGEALKKSGRTQADVDRHLGTNGMAGHYFGSSQWLLPTAEAYERLKEILPLDTPWAELDEMRQRLQNLKKLERIERLERLEKLERFQNLESLERIQRLESLGCLQSLGSLESLEPSFMDYRDLSIGEGAVIYCDPPYKGKTGYGAVQFDHAAFYDWCKRQKGLVVISEYSMPDGFVSVWERARNSCMAGGSYQKKVTERLYVRESDWERYDTLMAEGTFLKELLA